MQRGECAGGFARRKARSTPHAGDGQHRTDRGLRVVDLPWHTRATDPMGSGEKNSAQGRVQGGRWPSRSDAKRS